MVGVPPGGSKFVELIILREKLNPHKPKGEFRIFTYGESTMYGAHYGPTSSPARWLEAYLKDFLPGKKIRLVNFARLGKGSEFVRRTFKETIPYQPDLAIFYHGHNQFLHRNRKHEIEAEKRTLRYQIEKWSKKSRLICQVNRWVLALQMKLKKRAAEDSMLYDRIEAPPVGFDPSDLTFRNSKLYRENIQFFRDRVIRTINLGQKYHIPMIFLRPVSNLKDFAPYASFHLRDLSGEKLAEWEDLFEWGKEFEAGSREAEALDFYERAYGIDPTYAELSFRIGKLYFKKGGLVRARQLFEEARNYDALITRASSDILAVLDELKKTMGLDLIDVEPILISETPGGILGEPVIEDNVHLSAKGHALLGRALAEEISKRDLIVPRSEWKFGNERSHEAMAKELGIDNPLLFSASIKMVVYFGSRFENRIRFAQKALEISPGNPVALRHLAWSYWLMGKKFEAFETYRKLGQTYPEALREVFRHQPDIEKDFQAAS